MRFVFKAKNSKGEIKTGVVEATNRDSAVDAIQGNALIPLSIEIEKTGMSLTMDVAKLWEGVTAKEVAVFFRQLTTLVGAKVSIVISLKAIQLEMENRYFKMAIIEMIEDVEDGATLSEGMAKHPKIFNNLMINMVKAGEASGNLQKSIEFIADNVEKNQELNAKIKGALFYPTFVLAAAVLIGFGVFAFVLPKLTSVFKGMDIEIPWYTQALMNIGDFMNAHWLIMLIAIIALIIGFVHYFNTPEGKDEFERWSIKIPVFGKLLRYIYISRFAENLSILLIGGIPIVRALIIVSDVVNNVVYKETILAASEEVKKGGVMSTTLSRSPDFPSIVSSMVRIGEDSGKISEVLRNVSEFYTRETDRITRNLTSLIEPILIVVLGIGVAGLVFAILMPIYTMSGQIK